MPNADLLKLFFESERLLAQYQTLYQLAVKLCQPQDIRTLMRTVTDGVVELFNVPAAYIYVLSDEGAFTYPHAGDWQHSLERAIKRSTRLTEIQYTDTTLVAPVCEAELERPIAYVVIPDMTRTIEPKATERRLSTLCQIVAPATRSALVHESQRRVLHRAKDATAFGGLVGESPAMQAVKTRIVQVAKADASVLIQGATGTGKELVARAIHENSRRKDKRFVAFNCGALPETLIESELFGHVKGAFTDATQDRKGLFRQADGGTLFLDELGEMPLAQQVKLLRVLQEQEILPLGADQPVPINVRVVAATNQDLLQRVQDGRFRQDLYYRLAALETIHLPLLRERGNDILLLAESFLYQESSRFWFSEETKAALLKYDWPGNVRQLENAIKRAVTVSNGLITPDHLPVEVTRPENRPAPTPPPVSDVASAITPIVQQLVEVIAHATRHQTPPTPRNEISSVLHNNAAFADKVASGNLAEAREELEKVMIQRVWETYRPNLSRTAEKLGISRTQLADRLKKLGIR